MNKNNDKSDQGMRVKSGEEEHSDLELYGDSGIASKNAAVPKWLLVVYLSCVLMGLFWFYSYWNGSHGWLDRGYWSQLQRAANTTFPYTTREVVEREYREKHDASDTGKANLEVNQPRDTDSG